ncbi:MAG TPA: Kdo hydroxylase family protein [Phenylobacterium sp.]|uniref:Kdo hydroxylase family protein n=1 Tax=Phenylobacterium sp. TaxID=1871053 RepID=UPI002B4A5760|nr:Kdo hydroxylase family protein [Phenylobacterium sp.]HKR89150.1 Kdo hydroxylase family protein [Phenylobacterium sp.]
MGFCDADSSTRRARRLVAAGASNLQEQLEAGAVVATEALTFDFDPVILGASAESRAKNVSFNPVTGRLKGAVAEDEATLARALSEYAAWAEALVRRLLPGYGSALNVGKTSFRPRPAEAAISPRKDDRRLHVDAFPSQPTQGRRILRVFRNVNPAGVDRVWAIGEPFAEHAARFLPATRPVSPLVPWMLLGLGLTKGRRTAYDHVMLQLHDAAKASDDYQADAACETFAFAPGATWLVFTDVVPHAARSGRFAFEQTFFVPVEAMADPAAAPLAVLERMMQRKLT